METNAQVLTFQAETEELLRLLIHSLYTAKDVFLRELISNASDALDQLRFESLTNPALLEGNDKFEIRLDVDRTARTLTVHDTGIGMTRDEVIANIGTIAKSGTAELRQRMVDKGTAVGVSELIGQFGVGFYSAFMVADRVKLRTRRAGEAMAIEWESDGNKTYSIKEVEKSERGTEVTLHLKKPDKDLGIEDYTDSWHLSHIVKKHSDFIEYPIITKMQCEELNSDPAADAGRKKEILVEDRTLNSMRPIWKRFPTDVKPEEYAEFYRHISHDRTEAAKIIHFRAEGTFEYVALLYLPEKAPADLYFPSPDIGLRLFVNGVMIVEKCEALLPRYLRFIRGVVASPDLPLNLSRERPQQDSHISQIRKRLTRKILETLQELFNKEHDRYLTVWAEFGRTIKEGVSSDYDNKDKLIPLLLFQSSHDPKELTTLKEYTARMKPEQEQIFYLTGEDRNVIEASPHIEAVKQKGYELLYMVDPVDELLLQHLTDFEGKMLKSAGKGAIKLGTAQENEEVKEELKRMEEEYKPLIEFLQTQLSRSVKQVRLSARLTTSPACLVVEDYEFSPRLERLLQKGKPGEPKRRRVLELNPKHPLISGLRQRLSTSPRDPLLANAAEVLLGLTLLLESSEAPDMLHFSQAATQILVQVI